MAAAAAGSGAAPAARPSRSGCGCAAVRPPPVATRRTAATGNRETSQRVTQVAPAPGPFDRPVVFLTQRSRDHRAEPLPAVPRDHIESRRPPRVRRQPNRRTQRRHQAPQHVVPVPAQRRHDLVPQLVVGCLQQPHQRRAQHLQPRLPDLGPRSGGPEPQLIAHPAPGAGRQQPRHLRTPGSTQRRAQPRQPLHPLVSARLKVVPRPSTCWVVSAVMALSFWAWSRIRSPATRSAAGHASSRRSRQDQHQLAGPGWPRSLRHHHPRHRPGWLTLSAPPAAASLPSADPGPGQLPQHAACTLVTIQPLTLNRLTTRWPGPARQTRPAAPSTPDLLVCAAERP